MYFMRHGQSVFNAKEGCGGVDPQIPDACLSDVGKAQAARAGQQIVDHGFVRVVCSPYTRAIETASIVAAGLNLSVEVEPLIGEHRLYSCDLGSPPSQLIKAWPAVNFNGFAQEDWWLPFPESETSLQKRLHAFEKKWKEHKDWGKTLFVSHYYFISAATGRAAENTQVVTWRG